MMSEAAIENIYTCTPRQAKELILDALEARLVPFTKGSPGIGKSEIHAQIAKELNLELIDERFAGKDPVDFTGLPHFENGFAKFLPFEDVFPLQHTPLPKDKDGWLFFADEVNSAPKAVLAASYKFFLDRKAGQAKLNDRVVLAAAGNLDTDRAITNPIGTALQSRMVHIRLVVDFQEWLQDVAIPRNFDSRIIAYLSMYESHLMDFKPDHKNDTFCCPRTWEFMSRLIQGKEVEDKKVPLYAGTISPGTAVEFVQFTKVFKELVSIREILANPSTCHVSDDTSTRWATICHMMEKVDESNLAGLSTYASRFPLDFILLFFRAVIHRNPKLAKHPSILNARIELAKYLAS